MGTPLTCAQKATLDGGVLGDQKYRDRQCKRSRDHVASRDLGSNDLSIAV
jgi:ribosome biogenesis SPOUT family RNA methylase Rps3